MGKRGRVPKPTVLKIAEGNRGHERLNHNEPKPSKGAPSIPASLKGNERRLWRRTVKVLAGMKVLTKADAGMIERYCHLFIMYRECVKTVRAAGMSEATSQGRTQSAEFRGLLSLATELSRIEQQFGLTPSSRSSIHVEPVKDEDEFSEFVNRAKRRRATG